MSAMVTSAGTALVTGFTGQDGTFLTRLLLDRGYNVIGLVRRVSTEPPQRIRGKFDFTESINSGNLKLVSGDLMSLSSLIDVINEHRPTEIYNLASQSHVGLSFSQPELSIQSTFEGVVNLITALETVEKLSKGDYAWKLYQASSSEMFGSSEKGVVLNERSPLNPHSPYAIAKSAAHQYCKMKRDQGKFICSGILFNHESEIRGGDFVTQKIARGAVKFINTGEPIQLGNLDAMRDWGYAGDYVKAMHMMLQRLEPHDYVVATGETHTIRQFVEEAFRVALKIPTTSITWKGKGQLEAGYLGGYSEPAVVINPKYYRPNDVKYLNGDSTKVREELKWQPDHTFEEIVKIMVEAAE